jgi:hypothetical protein
MDEDDDDIASYWSEALHAKTRSDEYWAEDMERIVRYREWRADFQTAQGMLLSM